MKNHICQKGNIHLIGIAKKYYQSISFFAEKGLTDAKKLLHYTQNIDLVIFSGQSWEVHPKMSLSAFTSGEIQRIEMRIDFSRANIKDIIKTELGLSLHHEVAHVVRESTLGYSKTLLDYFMDEGIASYIEHVLMPKRKIPYIQKIKNEELFWEKAKKEIFQKIDWEYSREWFFGTGTLPNWIGYRLGYLIVQKFMEKHPTDLDTLVRMNSKNLIIPRTKTLFYTKNEV